MSQYEKLTTLLVIPSTSELTLVDQTNISPAIPIVSTVGSKVLIARLKLPVVAESCAKLEITNKGKYSRYIIQSFLLMITQQKKT